MKKILLITLLCLSICIPAQAGLTFLADYRNENIDAEYSKGSGTATFTRSGDGTYIDRYGVMQLEESDNVPRFTHYSYDETGLISTSGVYVEGAATNYLTHSIFDTDGGSGVSSGWGVATNVTGSVTTSLVDATSSFNVGTNVNYQRITFEAGVGDASKFIDIYSDKTAIGSFAQNDICTNSVVLKVDITGTIRVRLRVTEVNAADAEVANNNSDDIFATLSSSCKRFVYSTTLTHSDTNKIKIKISFDNIDDGDSGTIDIALQQAEKNSYATSFIPTTTTALTRNAEVLKYATLLNRTASVESMICKFYTDYDSTISGKFQRITDTDTKSRSLYINTNDFSISPNSTDSSSCSTAPSIVSWNEYEKISLGYNMQSGTSPYVSAYIDGLANGTPDTTDDFTPNTWGTYFYVGVRNSSTNQIDGIISQIAFFDKTLTDAEHLEYYNNNVTVTKFQGVKLQGLAT